MFTQITPRIEKLGQWFVQKSLLLSTAESCTAGGLAYALTSAAGSSAWFDRGLITYTNQAKQELLNITANALSTYGAVSAEVACAMADGALRNTLANIAIAITGIAGPRGGSVEKPVGTVWYAIAQDGKKTVAELQLFKGNRTSIREQAIEHAIDLLTQQLQVH